jgi:fimbrial chaperone protein
MVDGVTGSHKAGLLALLLLAYGPALAGSFAVNPVRISLSAQRSASVLTVRNDGAQPSVVHVEVVSWSQEAGHDVQVATREILATPPIFTMPVGGSQIVRIGLRHPPDLQHEVTYRVILREVPPPPSSSVSGLQVALRLSVPVFVLPPEGAAPVLEWQATRTPQGEFRVALSNAGNAHIQVLNLTLSPAGESQLLVKQRVAAYVLPRQTRSWIVKMAAPPAGTPLRLLAQTDAGDIQADIVVQETR